MELIDRAIETITERAPRVVSLRCAVLGHEEYVVHESGRMFLRCVNCGHESPGWSIESNTTDSDRKAA